MRVAQSSSTGDSGFSPTDSETIGGMDYKAGSSASDVVPVTTPDRNQSNGLYDIVADREIGVANSKALWAGKIIRPPGDRIQWDEVPRQVLHLRDPIANFVRGHYQFLQNGRER